jgi:cell division protein FtsN
MTVERLTYITLEPGNGGMILNVSEGGICFHAAIPILKTGTVHFRLSEPNVRIEADAELAWSDETLKKGGLRFTNLSSETRRQIRHWINQPAMLGTADHRYEPPLPSPCESPAVGASRPNAKTVRSSATAEVLSLKMKIRRVLRGFSGGLATGLLISALFGAAFFLYANRERFGESLIQWGERLGGRSRLQTAEPHPGPQEPNTTASSLPTVSAPIPVYRSDEPVSQPAPRAKSDPVKLEPTVPVRSAPPRPILRADGVISPAIPPPSLSVIPIAPTSNLNPGVFASAPPTVNFSSNRIETSKEAGIELPSERYLEVGKFKERFRADQTTDRLGQLGFPAIVTQRGHLWMGSYHVLVGPYGNDREVKAAHNGLMSRGFKPRSFEKGSRNFSTRSGFRLNGIPIPFGDYSISWESYASDAVVKFEDKRSVVITTEAKLIRGPSWHNDNAFVYIINADGSRTLLEIRFAGTNQTLVFGKSW